MSNVLNNVAAEGDARNFISLVQYTNVNYSKLIMPVGPLQMWPQEASVRAALGTFAILSWDSTPRTDATD